MLNQKKNLIIWTWSCKGSNSYNENWFHLSSIHFYLRMCWLPFEKLLRVTVPSELDMSVNWKRQQKHGRFGENFSRNLVSLWVRGLRTFVCPVSIGLPVHLSLVRSFLLLVVNNWNFDLSNELILESNTGRFAISDSHAV